MMKLKLLPLFCVLLMTVSCKEELCDNTCFWPEDGVCDDGGQGSTTDFCQFGTDCADCGIREE